MRRACWILAPLLLVGATGCLPLFYAYPALSYTPGIAFGPNHKDIFAFRLDVTDDSAGAGDYRLRALPISRAGQVMGQGKPEIEDGYYWNLFVQTYARQVSHTLLVRIYRPGFESVEIQSWHLTKAVQWNEITDPAAREKAIDNLLCTRSGDLRSGPDHVLFAHLESATPGTDHRLALLFAAREYERLAEFVTANEGDEQVADRCSEKAKRLHALAGK